MYTYSLYFVEEILQNLYNIMQVGCVYYYSKGNILTFRRVTLEEFVITACKDPQTHERSSKPHA